MPRDVGKGLDLKRETSCTAGDESCHGRQDMPREMRHTAGGGTYRGRRVGSGRHGKTEWGKGVPLTLTSLRAGLPAQPDFRACCSYLPQPGFPLRTMATCHSPTSDYMPTWALLPIPDNDGCVRQTWRLRPKRVCPRTGVTLTAASTARGLPKTMSADDKTRSASYQPSTPCAERRQFLRILNSPAGP